MATTPTDMTAKTVAIHQKSWNGLQNGFIAALLAHDRQRYAITLLDQPFQSFGCLNDAYKDASQQQLQQEWDDKWRPPGAIIPIIEFVAEEKRKGLTL